MPTQNMPLAKRLIDIAISGTALVVLSPIVLIIAIIIKLESKGPILYGALRAGAGYKLFPLYKFRTMYADADQKLKQMSHLNLYAQSAGETLPSSSRCDDCAAQQGPCSPVLYLKDGSTICEKRYLERRRIDSGPAFVKFKDDPRITRVGKFLRNTSLDELPQLFNVLRGDMSLVGNRPLPLYEAEHLTTDGAAYRFLAPAGITGLWQVIKRGRAEMSAEERIELDKEYAGKYSLWFDLKIIARTFPALLQSENV